MYKTHTARVFLLCMILLAGACSDDSPVIEAETKAAVQQPELSVREWYPTPKHARPRIVISPTRPSAQMPVTQQPTPGPAPVVTPQQWYAQPQPYATPQQYPYANPYQYDQRPWGSVPGSTARKQTESSQNSSPQGTATDYWGMPVYGGGQYYYYPAPGMYGHAW